MSLASEPEDSPTAVEPAPDLGAPYSVLIAGGGVGALEAVLTLSSLAADEISVELVCPEREFSLRALSVNEPFGADPPRKIDLEEFCARNGATLRNDRLAEIWGGRQRVLFDSGEDVYYDALLLAFGARPDLVLNGSHAFRGPPDVGWFGELLNRLERGEVPSLAFAVPREVGWSLPLYELALMTGRRLRKREVAGVTLSFITHEDAPLKVFGESGSGRVAELLDREAIELICGRHPVGIGADALVLDDGTSVEASEVVSLPALVVPEVPGLPQGRHGFIGTDAEMRVEGLERVWAVGDATWFPIKQGGIAAQQADVAACSIAASAGLPVEVPAFRPIVRGALLTGDEPEFLRAAIGADDDSSVATQPLWWPPGKVAGARLAPYLAREWTGGDGDPLVSMEDLIEAEKQRPAALAEHRDALSLSLRFADVDAAEGDLKAALRWLAVAERLNVVLPEKYEERRREWRDRLQDAQR